MRRAARWPSKFGVGDAGLKSYLSQFGFVSGYGGAGGTDDITQWLAANCPGKGKQ